MKINFINTHKLKVYPLDFSPYVLYNLSMPYIKQDKRSEINAINIGNFVPENAGELQFVIAHMINNYHLKHGLSYQKCNDLMGGLAGAQMEYYRQVVAPYEDEKMAENGDCYDVNKYKMAVK